MVERDPIQTTARTYDLIAKPYSDKYYDYFKNNIEHLHAFIQQLPIGAHILDAGSGPGGISEYLSQQGFLVSGVDIAPGMVRLAKLNVPGVDFRQMDIRQLDFTDNTFGGIVADYSLIHIPREDLLVTLKGFYRVLQDGGVLYVSVFEGDEERFIDEPFKPEEKTFWNFMPAELFREMIVAAGFKIIYVKRQKTEAEEEFLDTELFFIGQRK